MIDYASTLILACNDSGKQDLTPYCHNFNVKKKPKKGPKYIVGEFNRLIVRKENK